jgi:hypothetical protein
VRRVGVLEFIAAMANFHGEYRSVSPASPPQDFSI